MCGAKHVITPSYTPSYAPVMTNTSGVKHLYVLIIIITINWNIIIFCCYADFLETLIMNIIAIFFGYRISVILGCNICISILFLILDLFQSLLFIFFFIFILVVKPNFPFFFFFFLSFQFPEYKSYNVN